MTYRSLWIEAHASQESAEAPYLFERAPEQLISLNAFTFAVPLSDFAKDRRLELTYIDNAWLRVAMGSEAMRHFVALGRPTEIDVNRQLELIEDDR